jgi:hypothetical protein
LVEFFNKTITYQMNGNPTETSSTFNKARVVGSWLEAPDVVNTNESRLSMQLDGEEGSHEKPENILNPQGHQDDFVRDINKVRLGIHYNRQRMDSSSHQLNQSKSIESLTNKNRLQFIQQKFKEKEELLLLQQNIIQNLKRDIKHRDHIISTLREGPPEETISGTLSPHRQEFALKKLGESAINPQMKSRIKLESK